jgi:uncharacterized damage-inducible protein DinB
MSSANATPTKLMFADIPSEFASTRRVLERVPDGNNDWHPHEKSMSLGRLATHLAELPRFGTMILTTDELDWAVQPYQPTVSETTAERLALFDDLTAKMQDELAKADWEILAKEWTMRRGDQIFAKGPKGMLIRSAGISHMAHHRAQLGVYLRLIGVPVPRVYGPSADEPV